MRKSSVSLSRRMFIGSTALIQDTVISTAPKRKRRWIAGASNEPRMPPIPPHATLDQMKAFLKDRLGKHEMIGALEIRDELPKTPVGKISKKDLREYEARSRSS